MQENGMDIQNTPYKAQFVMNKCLWIIKENKFKYCRSGYVYL